MPEDKCFYFPLVLYYYYLLTTKITEKVLCNQFPTTLYIHTKSDHISHQLAIQSFQPEYGTVLYTDEKETSLDYIFYCSPLWLTQMKKCSAFLFTLWRYALLNFLRWFVNQVSFWFIENAMMDSWCVYFGFRHIPLDLKGIMYYAFRIMHIHEGNSWIQYGWFFARFKCVCSFYWLWSFLYLFW